MEKSHPEATCEKCGGRNGVWFTANVFWNKHIRSKGFDVICPLCFIEICEADGFVPTSWYISPETIK